MEFHSRIPGTLYDIDSTLLNEGGGGDLFSLLFFRKINWRWI